MTRMPAFRVLAFLAAVALLGSSAGADDDDCLKKKPLGRGDRVKNVIMLVPDGCSASVQTLARWYQHDKDKTLCLDSMLCGAVRTYMSNSVIPGSAATATAFATGHKTYARFIGIGPRGDDVLSTLPTPPKSIQYRPLATVLEGAKLMGKSTGLIATSRITHATPASFAAHIRDRGWDNEIMEHMVYNEVDVVFGGGKRHLIPKADGGKRTDGEDLLKVLKSRGVSWVSNTAEMKAAKCAPVWGLFADSHMAAHIDRDPKVEPSIAEMTKKAIQLLSKDEDGFFLLVEGSQVDWAGHANDPIHWLTDFLAFDEAVKVAVEFAKKDGKTAVWCFPDHNTGGPAIGNWTTDGSYTSTSVEDLLGPLAGMKITSNKLAYEKIGSDTSNANIRKQIKEWWGLDITEADADAILELNKSLSLNYAISRYISANYTVLGFTTHGHNGEDVPLWCYGRKKLCGLYDNTDLATMAAHAMGFKLARTNLRLYVEVDKAFSDYEIDWSDKANPVLVIGKAELPISKDLLYIGKKTYNLEGLVVYVDPDDDTDGDEKVYIPMQAVKLIKKDLKAKKNRNWFDG
jgi:alkaline phosphatase